jgi:hypothetical protein
MKRRSLIALLVAVCTALSGFAGVAQADSGSFTLQVVAAQLRNPRGMAIAADGTIYVAEAGRAGRRCVTVGEGEESFEHCFGTTSAVTRVRNGRQQRVVTGLPSHGERSGFASLGAHDVAVTPGGNLVIAVGLGATPEDRRAILGAFGPDAASLGTLMTASPGGEASIVRNVFRFEYQNNPDGGHPARHGVDSNPYAVMLDGRDRIVVDAGGNSLIRYRPGTRPRAIATFQGPRVTNPFDGSRMRAQSVPTSVAKGPDGAYYVGELTGFPFEKGSARVWRVVPGRDPQVYARGFTNIIDVAFDASGNLLVLEMTKDGLLAAEMGGSMGGRLVRVSPSGAKTTLVTKGLVTPTSVAVARNGDIYLTNDGLSPGDGKVVKLNRR